MYASSPAQSQPPSMTTSSTRPLQLDQWANTKAPLTSSQRSSVNRLAEWLHRNSPEYKQQQQASTSKLAGVNGSSNDSAPQATIEATAGDDAVVASTSDLSNSKMSEPIALPDAGAPLVSAQSFLAWYTHLSDSVTSSTQTSHRQALQRISDTTSTADHLLAQLEACQVNVSELRAGTAFVQDSSRGIREQAQSLLDSQTHLDTLAEDIASRLSFFTLLPYATNMLSSPDNTIVYTQSFLELMDQLDVALLYLQQEPARSYRDAALYRMRYSQCVTRAATLAKMAVIRDLKTESERTADKLKQLTSSRASKDSQTSPATTASSTDPHGKARQLSDDDATNNEHAAPLAPQAASALFDDAAHQVTRLRPLIFELQKRASNTVASSAPSASTAAEFESLLQECTIAWFQYRRPLLSRVLLQHITDIEMYPNEANVHPVLELARAGTQLLKYVLQRESDLYQQFFVGGTGSENGLDAESSQGRGTAAALGTYMSELAETLAARLRPKLSKEDDLLVLAQISTAIADVTRTDAGPAAILTRGLMPLLNETQSRLITRAQSIVTSDVAGFVPSEQEGHLDFPERIQKHKANLRDTGVDQLSAATAATSPATAAGKGQHRRGKSGAGLLDAALSASQTASSSKTQQEKVELFTLPAALLSTYYAPVQHALQLLYHLQALVPAPAFRRLALAAVDGCLASSVKGATALVKRQKGDSLEREDGWLFELRQVEMLREVVVSAELVLKQAHEEQAATNAAAAGSVDGGVAASGAGTSLVDLSSLVTAINSLWTNTGRLLYPSSATAATAGGPPPSTQLDMQPSSTHVASRLQALIEQIAQLWSDSILLPLRVYVDQSSAEASAAKFSSTYQAFETCVESILPEKAGKVALWIEDQEVQRLIVRRITDAVGQAYGRFYEMRPADAGEIDSVSGMMERVRREWDRVLVL
ncbi:Conserved oligomeric Golgi complex subunit 3 [Pseudozyma hubeiensis]|nr:Conserved oligomeric Golgi complex subunit 3 [Pseudozyma hubeiensis]